jgi:putative acetyltransferase
MFNGVQVRPPSETTIREESPIDYDGIDRVNRLAFGRGDEALVVDRLRAARLVITSLVAVSATDGIVGHILFSRLPIHTGAGRVAAVSLGPVAVQPEYQRRGIGAALIRAGLDNCRQAGESIVIVVGHPGYYPHFGFSSELAKSLQSPFHGEAWMALELRHGALEGVRGVVEYPPAWGIEDGAAS